MLDQLAPTSAATAGSAKLILPRTPRGRRMRIWSSLLEYAGVYRADNDQTRDDQCCGHSSDEEDTPSTRGEFTSYDPILHVPHTL